MHCSPLHAQVLTFHQLRSTYKHTDKKAGQHITVCVSLQVPLVFGAEGKVLQPGRRAEKDAPYADLALYIHSTCTHTVAHAVHAVGLTCR